MKRPEIPESWVVAPIGELLAPLGSGRFLDHGWSPQCHKEPSRTVEEWGVLKTTSIQPGAFYDVHNKRLPNNLLPRPNLEVRSGDLLLTCAGPRARCGVPCLIRETRRRLMLSGKMYRFRARQELLDSRYLEAFLLANTTQFAIDRMKTGISDSGLNLTHKRFLSLPVVLAPLPEQRRIIEAVESYFTRLDDAIATLERVQRNLKRYRASVLKAAIEGRLEPTEAELARAEGRSYEPASILLERILAERRYLEDAQRSKVKPEGKVSGPEKRSGNPVNSVAADTFERASLPEGWEWASAETVCARVVSGSTPVASKLFSGSGDVPFVKVYNLTMTGALDFTVKPTFIEIEIHEGQLRRSRVVPGDVLTNIVGPPLGQVSVVPHSHAEWNINQAIAAFRPSSGLLTGWLRIILMSEPTQRWLRGTAKTTTSQVNLAISSCRRLPMPLPPIAEQARIVDEVDRLLSIALDLETKISHQLAKVLRLRQSILKWAFEGRLVDQDPADEPASRLLDRIRAERESASDNPKRRPRRAKGASARS